MLDRQPELRIMDPGPLARRLGRNDDEPAVDLRAVVHPRRILLADIAALFEGDSVQLPGVAFEPERPIGAQFGQPFGDAEALAPGTAMTAPGSNAVGACNLAL